MKWNRVPALTGCFGLVLAGSMAWGQAGTTSGSQQTNPTGASPAPPSAQGTQPNGTGMAGASAGNQANAASDNKSSDKKFVQKAMAGGEAEVALGKLATEKASDPNVKEFGQKMVDDHTKLNDQMKPIASQLGVTPPSSLPSKDQKLQAKLQGLSGADFDKAYMSAMVKDHHKDLSEFQHEAQSAKDPQLKDAAQQGAQVIQQHLQLAEQVAQKVGGKAGKNQKGSNGEMTPPPSTTTSPQ